MPSLIPIPPPPLLPISSAAAGTINKAELITNTESFVPLFLNISVSS